MSASVVSLVHFLNLQLIHSKLAKLVETLDKETEIGCGDVEVRNWKVNRFKDAPEQWVTLTSLKRSKEELIYLYKTNHIHISTSDWIWAKFLVWLLWQEDVSLGKIGMKWSKVKQFAKIFPFLPQRFFMDGSVWPRNT